MKLSQYKDTDFLIIRVEGRLDATWADYFKEEILVQIRGGEHKLLLDATALSFLSSMGIRSLILIAKELKKIAGELKIANCTKVVRTVLQQSGLATWLSEEDFDWDALQKKANSKANDSEFLVFELNKAANLSLHSIQAWKAWKVIDEAKSKNISLKGNCFALGIAAGASSYEEGKEYFGEMLAVAGHVAILPPNEEARPDLLISEENYSPSVFSIQSLACSGTFSKLTRFKENRENVSYTLEKLVEKQFSLHGSDQIGFVIVGEIEGLVGVSLTQSPANIKAELELEYPEIKKWISFCGERSFAKDQAIITGIASRKEDKLSYHMHAAVFPYQFLPNGEIGFKETMDRFFQTSTPKTIMHLVKDMRPGIGLGETALYQGAIWSSSIVEEELAQ